MSEVVVTSLVGLTLLAVLVVALGITNRRQGVAIRERGLAESRLPTDHLDPFEPARIGSRIAD